MEMRDVLHLPEIKNNYLTGENVRKPPAKHFRVKEDTSLYLLHCFLTLASQEMTPSFRRQAKSVPEDIESKKQVSLPDIKPKRRKTTRPNRFLKNTDTTCNKWRHCTTGTKSDCLENTETKSVFPPLNNSKVRFDEMPGGRST